MRKKDCAQKCWIISVINRQMVSVANIWLCAHNNFKSKWHTKCKIACNWSINKNISQNEICKQTTSLQIYYYTEIPTTSKYNETCTQT